MTLSSRNAILSIAILACFIAVKAEGTVMREVLALPSTGPKIDGILEDDWFIVQPASDFLQVEPFEGEPASMQTYVYVLFSSDALYIAFDCKDASPDSITEYLKRRDDSSDADLVYLNLDSFHDRRTGYFFGVSAAGVQHDGTWSNENMSDDSWDGVWESAVRHNHSGWVVEMRIPFSGFRHGGSRDDGWGVNFTRVIHRRNEWSSWQPVDRNRGQRVNEFGRLNGINGLKPLMHVEVLPHAVGRWDSPENSPFASQNDWDNFGVDLKIAPSSSWTLDLTLQPDFAQVDVDDEEINLSDYPLYVEEKRPFFLEGLGLFQGMPIDIFYTRRINNPDFGGRVTGQWGNVRSSALVAHNLDPDGMEQEVAAARSVLNFGQGSTIGFTGTMLREEGYHANTGMIDTRLRWDEENFFDLSLAGVDLPDAKKQPVGARMELYLAKDNWRGATFALYSGQDFNINDLGFAGGQYSRAIQQRVWVQRAIFPKETKLQSFHINFNLGHEFMPDGKYYERFGNVNAHAHTHGNHYFGGGMSWGSGFFRERYEDEWEEEGVPEEALYDNYGAFLPEWHPWYYRWIYLETDNRKPVEVHLFRGQGTFREGYTWENEADVIWKAISKLEISSALNWTRVWEAQRVNDGEMSDFRILRLRTRYSPTINVSLRGTVQYVLEDEALLTNLLLAWNWSPGSWLYLVYDESRETDLRTDWITGDRTIRMKWSYFISN